MRLWHYKLIPYLPKSQLVSQWRELNSVFKKQDNHLLINYIYNYEKNILHNYTYLVVKEMERRKYKIKKWDNYVSYFAPVNYDKTEEMFKEHNDEYLLICYHNLKEKFIRGQKDFSEDCWHELDEFVRKEFKIGGR